MAGGDVIHGCYVRTDETFIGQCCDTTGRSWDQVFVIYRKTESLCNTKTSRDNITTSKK